MYSKKSININNQKLAYYEFGNGDKTLIFLSGFGTPFPLLDMYNLATKLENDFRCIIIDRFGYGNSDIIYTKRNAQNITNEIIEFLIKLNINPKDVVVIGHSLGALYALNISLNIKIRGVVLIDYENISVFNSFMTKLGYGIYYGMSNTPLKEKQDENMIKFSVENLEVPKEIKNMSKKCIKEKMPNVCIKSELDSVLSDFRNVIKNIKNKKLNFGIFIYTKRNEKANIKLNNYFKDYKNILVNTKNHFIHYEKLQMITNEIKNYFIE